jgi:hypothetical protein
MKKVFLAGGAVLLLATGAQAEEPPDHQLAFEASAEDVWHFNDYKKCTARVEFKIPPNPKDWLLRTDLSLANDTAAIIFDQTNLAKLETAVRYLEKCRPWFWDRSRQRKTYER